MSNVPIDPNVTGSQETADKTETPYLTKEEFNARLNSAISNHLKRIDITKQISESLETSLATFREQLGSSKSQESKEAVPGQSPEISSMQKKLEMMEKQMKAKEEAIMLRDRQSREKEAFAKVSAELKNHGVRPEAVDVLAKVFKAENRIKVDDEGNVSFLQDEDNEVDLKDGLKNYLDPKKNPYVGLFLPPKQVTKGKSTVSTRMVPAPAQESKNLSFKDKAYLASQQIKNLNKK